MRKITIVACLFILFSFQLVLAEEANFCRVRQGGRLVLSATSGPKSFNPIVAKETSTTAITGLIFEGLTRTDGVTQEVKPNLAQSWEVSEDGKTWIFYLRQDARWFDGKPFTADDVVFTFNHLIFNPDIPSSSRDIFIVEGRPIAVEKIDDFTVSFRLPVVFAPFLRMMAQNILPKHRLKDVVERGEFNYHWGLGTKPEDIIGTGPFKLRSFRPEERVILERNENYWQKDDHGCGLPYLDELMYVIVRNEDVALLKFLEGEIDHVSVRGQDYPIVKPQEARGGFTVYDVGPQLGSNFLVFNQNMDINPTTGKTYISSQKLSWFREKKFRRAVAYAIDRQSIIDIVYNGLGYRQFSPVPESAGFFHNPDVKKYEYNPEKSLKLLRKIGIYDRNNDGILEDKDGNQIRFNLFTNAENEQRRSIAGIIRRDLESLGLRVNFVPLAFNQIVAKLDSTYDWDAVLLGLTGGPEPHFGRNVWASSGHLHMWYPRQKEPATEWEAEIDLIFDKAVQILDEDKRKLLYDRWQEIVAKKVPFVYTIQAANIFAIRDKFGNLKPTPLGGAFHNIEEIYLRDQ